MDTTDNFNFIAQAAKAFGDRTRLRIFREIIDRGSLNMSEVQQLSKLSYPAVSFHVKQLVNAELLESVKQGREVHLSINQSKLQEFKAILDYIKALSSN
jgi:DNA-binding transcriptional ArsR family regulator